MRLYIFDCDGTLVDSQRRIVASMESAAREAGLSPPPAEAIRSSVGLRLEDAAARLYPTASDQARESLVENYRRAFHEFSVADGPEPLFEGCREALSRMSQPDELLAVATGKSRRGLLRVLEQQRLRDIFVDTQTADDGPGKPNPAILIELLDRCGVERERAVMIGDTSFDMEMAVHAGVRRLGVSWGYHARETLLDAGAETIVDCFAELPEAARNLVT